MNVHGHIEQIGAPKQIYEYPVSSYVAQFVGSTNIFEGTFKDEMLEVSGLGSFPLHLPQRKPWIIEGAHLSLSIRPEKLGISRTEPVGFSTSLSGMVEAIVYHGRSTQYNVRLKNGTLVHVFEQNEEHLALETIDYESNVYIYWHKENGVLLER